MSPEEATIHDYSTTFFHHVASGIRKLKAYKNGLTVELFAGDGFKFVDRIRFRDPKLARPVEYPVLFDRCHLSNVPDYT